MFALSMLLGLERAASHFTHCNLQVGSCSPLACPSAHSFTRLPARLPLQRVHLALSLRSAMSIFFKIKNYNTCATFCRRLLELQPDEKVGGSSGEVVSKLWDGA